MSDGHASDDLGAALVDLGRHLGPQPVDDDFVRRVLADVDALPVARDAARDAAPVTSVPPRSSGLRLPRRRLAVAAAVVVAILVAVLAVPPAREAVARWFGIGSVQITRLDQPPALPAASTTAAPPPGTVADLAAIAREVGFDLRVPDPAVAGPLLDARSDPSVPSGLVELRFGDLTVVEMAARVDERAVVSKMVGPDTTVTPVTVDGRPGLWLAGAPHGVVVVGANGQLVFDDVRRAGNVLLWERDGITTRIEGAPTLERAQAVAASLG